MTSSKSTKSTPHKLSTNVNCMVLVDDVLLINHYKFEIGFYTINENPILNDIALDQIEMFFNVLLRNSIMMDKKDYDHDCIPKDIKNNIFMVPGKSNDQVVACLVYLKLVNIVGNNLEIDYVSISSELGKEICYSIDSESLEIEALIPSKEDWWDDDKVAFLPWWNRPDTSTYDLLINRDEIYTGDFLWEDIFKDELEEAANFGNQTKGKFKVINGGKDGH